MAHFRKECITLMMTTRCDMACSYCYLQMTKLPKQSIETIFAERGIHDFFEGTESRHVRFFGAGEPTLEFEKIKHLRSFAYGLAGDKLLAEIQTNGAFSRSIAEWLSTNMAIVWISCDGPPDVQDVLRPKRGGQRTSLTIERNIGILLQGSTMVGCRATITPLNIYRQRELIQYFYDLGIRAVFSDPVFPPVLAVGECAWGHDIEPDFALEYAKEFVDARDYASQLGMFYGSILTVNFDEPTEIFCRACSPNPHLTTDGYVTCCDMSYMGHILPELVYGRFVPESDKIEYYEDKIRAIRLRRGTNLRECRGCEVLRFCAGACFGEGLNETGKLLGVKKDYCEAIRYLASHSPLGGERYPYLHP